jgi:hypothetical protein
MLMLRRSLKSQPPEVFNQFNAQRDVSVPSNAP